MQNQQEALLRCITPPEAKSFCRKNKWLLLAEETAGFGHWYLNLEDHSMYWSDKVKAFYGLKPGAEIPSFQEIIDVYHKGQRARIRSFVNKTLRSNEANSFGLALDDGLRPPLYLKAFARTERNVQGRPIGLFGVFQDVTREQQLLQGLKEKQLQFEYIQETSLDGFWDWNILTGKIYLSARLKEMLGYHDHEMENSIEAWQRVIFPDDREIARRAYLQHVIKGVPYEPIVRYRHKDGSVVWVMCRGKVIFNQDGQPARMIGAHTDITRLKKTEEKLKSTIEALQHFTRIASHDLREPLRGVSFFASQLQSMLKDNDSNQEEIENYFDFIMKSVSRMDALIEGVGQFTRLPEQVELSSVDLNVALSAACESLARMISENKAHVSVDKLPNVLGSQTLLISVFQNLIQNAIKFTEKEKQPEIKVYLQENTPEGYDTVCVKDNGIGIQEKYIDEIFKPFRRLHPFHEYEGSGIGLAVVKKVVELHGGVIKAKSTPGNGAIFEIKFPKMEVERSP